MLKGKKGQQIDTDVLKMIYDSLHGVKGVEQAYSGPSFTEDGQQYHYEYWMTSPTGSQTQQEMFLQENKGVAYGQPIKFSFTADKKAGAAAQTVLTAQDGSHGITAAQADAAAKTGNGNIYLNQPATIKKLAGMDGQVRGFDISSYPALMKAGVKFYNAQGQEEDLFKLVKDAGATNVRLRLWNDPYNAKNQTYGGGDDNLTNVVEMAKKAKANNLKVLLDLQYSDLWADPAAQKLPKAWKSDSDEALLKDIYNYTTMVMTTLKNAGITVDSVQDGNEITSGCFGINNGQAWNHADEITKMCQRLNAGAAAIRAVSPNAKIIIHVEGLSEGRYRNIMHHLRDEHVDYDIFGTSYYPFWGAKPNDLKSIINMASNEYHKPVMVMETAWVNSSENFDGTPNTIGKLQKPAFSVSSQGQIDQMTNLFQTLTTTKGSLGAYYWEPAWVPVMPGWGGNKWEYNKLAGNVFGTGWASEHSKGYLADSRYLYNGKGAWGGSSWDNATLFNENGRPMSSLDIYNGLTNGTQPQHVTVPELPATSGKQVIPNAPKASSKINFNVIDVYAKDNAGKDLAIKDGIQTGAVLSLDDLKGILPDKDIALLTGPQGSTIGDQDPNNASDLKTIAQALQGNQTAFILPKTYQTSDGHKVQYEVWLGYNGNQAAKVWNICNDNKNVTYGQPLTINIKLTAKLLSDPTQPTTPTKPKKQATSTINFKVTSLYAKDNAGKDLDIKDGIKLNDQLTLDDLKGILPDSAKALLTGPEGSTIGDQNPNLKTIAQSLKGNQTAFILPKTYQTSDGRKVQYEVWLDYPGNQDGKVWNICNPNKNITYGQALPINISLTAKVIDSQPSQPTTPTKPDADDQAVSEIQPVMDKIFAGNNDFNNFNHYQVGQALPADQAAAVKSAVSADLLKGKKGTLISDDVLKKIFNALPGNKTALTGPTAQNDKGQKVQYEFWLDGSDKQANFLAANKGAKYGDALKVNYLTNAKWIG